MYGKTWIAHSAQMTMTAIPRDVLLSCLKDEWLAVAARCAQGSDERAWRHDVGRAEVLKELINVLENGAKAPDAVSGISVVT